MITKEEFAEELIKIFPEKSNALAEHYKNYGELLGHIFFSEEINIPLTELLEADFETEKIDKYCRFVEKMWKSGTPEAVNIVDVTILEYLSDNDKVWGNFGRHILQDFKNYINNDVLHNNDMMFGVRRLSD